VRLLHTAALLGLALVLGGCVVDAPQAPDSPPLTRTFLGDVEPDRLWILLQAARFGDGTGCDDLYLEEVHEDAPRRAELAPRCSDWTEMFAEYLRANGVSMAEAEHLTRASYWIWWREKRGAITECRKQYTVASRETGEEMRARRYNRNACDPFLHVTKNAGRTSLDLGIAFTGKTSPAHFEDLPLGRLGEGS